MKFDYLFLFFTFIVLCNLENQKIRQTFSFEKDKKLNILLYNKKVNIFVYQTCSKEGGVLRGLFHPK